VIQGGMSVAISGWRLANAVCRAAQMGVISGSLLDTVFVRRLQDGQQTDGYAAVYSHNCGLCFFCLSTGVVLRRFLR
jgi:NAD(P)H-dependent flavin oxidoreductase YrpB (nitropropane dioxygenase family)